MVSSDEIKRKLHDKQNNPGYLVCDKCKGYYELQPGESPADFAKNCECGGDLHYSKQLNTATEKKNYNKDSKSLAKTILYLIIYFILICIALILFIVATQLSIIPIALIVIIYYFDHKN